MREGGREGGRDGGKEKGREGSFLVVTHVNYIVFLSPSLHPSSSLLSLPSHPPPFLPHLQPFLLSTVLSDYVPLTRTLVFAPMETEHTIPIEILDNNAVERTERFFGQLAIPPGEQGVTLVEDTASVLIYDEDGEMN